MACSSSAPGSRPRPPSSATTSRPSPTSRPRSARPAGTPRRRLRLSDPLRLARHPHPRRPPEHAGRDEPGGAQSPPRRARAGRDADRQRGRLHEANLRKAGYEENPLDDGSLDGYQLFRVPMTTLTTRATEDIEGLKPAEAQRTKNLFALGLISWMYGRPTESTISWLETKFAKRPAIRDANIAAFKAGYNFGETTEIAATPVEIEPAPLEPGEYRNINGAHAMAIGLIAASVRSGLQLFFASYPITPASELLHPLARHDRFGVRTVQAEDELAAANMALGASFGGKLGVTATSGPGMDLKAETIGARGDGRAADGDHRRPAGRALDRAADQNRTVRPADGDPRPPRRDPLPVFAPSTPADCFTMAVEAVRTAVRYRTPVILLGDTFLANSSEPWRLPDSSELPEIDPELRRGAERGRRLPALPPRRARRPALGDPRHPRPPAPARRPREGARQRQHQLRPRQPRADDEAAGGEAREPGRGAAAARGRRRRRRRAAGARLGLDLRRDPRRGPPRARTRHPDRDRPPAPPANRCRPTPARSSGAIPRSWSPSSTPASC